MSNPLQKYFRQPKVYISLPSKGVYFSPESFVGDYSNMPVFAMTGLDEIIMKTPDALFSGEATVKLIESCCPYIKNAHEVASLDVDAILVAIRIATFGETLNISKACKKCGHENDYEASLPAVLDQISNKTFENILEINELSVTLKPLSYKEMIEYNIENFKLQKMLVQLNQNTGTEEENQVTVDNIYIKLAEIQGKLLLDSIESIKTPDAVVTEREFIKEWLSNTIKDSYNIIKSRLEQNKKKWEIPPMTVQCNECQTEDTIQVELDQSSFFD